MGLVGYSDSEGSDSEGPAPPPPKPNATKPSTTTKPAFTKLIDRQSNKIKVQLPGATATSTAADGERPTKRAKMAGGSGGGFNAMLPAPKRTGAIRGPAANTNGTGSAKKGLGKGLGVGVNLKTSAAAAFSRERAEPDPDFFDRDDFGAPVAVPERNEPERSVQRETEDEVEADMSSAVTNEAQTVTKVTKPMMFKPLSVMQREKAKKKKKLGAQAAIMTLPATAQPLATQSKIQQPSATPEKPKVSLFSISSEETASRGPSANPYEPILENLETKEEANPQVEYGSYEEQSPYAQQTVPSSAAATALDLSSIASDLNLTPAERRRLFGRNAFKDPSAAALPAGMSIKSYNAEAQYAENEAIRASGEEIAKAPVRAIASGKHSLKQLISNATNQKDALEESFARGRDNKREAGAKYAF